MSDRHILGIRFYWDRPVKDRWQATIRYRRLSVGGTLMCHRTPWIGDRWVFQTSSHYDRKPPKGTTENKPR